ncbi:uncharacterized protein LOC123515921 isoform X1 [Portunus trituberculatus]|uniref:uncharacterized protein LOC123515921 isoform X1 n=1 Tax=Portunus trituberculatus TaxID=210409 RepID=UPI001E1CD68B|nr:uncharacterized protein LOC123515921 isoform X1 [Portunus trituberculatus]
MYRYDGEGNVVDRYGGNVRMVETVAEIFNFSIHYVEPPHGILWGYELTNGSWTGLVGVFERGDADIGIANLFISDLGGRHKHQHYTSSYGQQKLAAQYSVMMDFEEVYKHLVAGQGAYMASRNNLIYTISLYSKSGIPTLRLMKECFQPYSTALGVQSNSPLKRNLDRAVTWIAESGMPYQWVRETLMIVRKDRKATSDVTVNIISSESGSRISFSMEHLQGVFIMFGVGCGLSFLVFLTEIPFYQ